MNRPQGLPNCNWVDTFIFQIPRFSERKMVVHSGKENYRRIVKWVVLSGCLSGWRKWFPKSFPRQHGPKLNLVWGRSRRVWETRSRVFRGIDDWSKSHHSHYRNGDDWHCLNVPPSVVLMGLTMITPVRIETVWRTRVYINALFANCSMMPLFQVEYLVFILRSSSWCFQTLQQFLVTVCPIMLINCPEIMIKPYRFSSFDWLFQPSFIQKIGTMPIDPSPTFKGRV